MPFFLESKQYLKKKTQQIADCQVLGYHSYEFTGITNNKILNHIIKKLIQLRIRVSFIISSEISLTVQTVMSFIHIKS